MDKKCGILLVSVTIFVLSFVGTASAMTWYVDDDGGADFTGIQEAINNASDGDTIIVYSGVYYENVVVDKSITLKGNGQPVVDGGGKGDAITLNADGIKLVGFTATGCSWFDAGIKVISNNNTITGNNASDNRYGIIVYNSSNNNKITGNNVSNNDDGIYLYDSCNNNITGNNISNNSKHGISLTDSSNNKITGNNASNNDDGIRLDYSGNNTITGNNVYNNWVGIHLYDSSNNTITGNNVSNNNWNGIRLYDSSSNNTITGNIFVNDGLYVSSSYQNTVEDNTVNGKPLVYLEDVSDYKVEDAGQVILVNCNNITVENLDLSYTCVGIELWETGNSIISNNTASDNSNTGIILYSSSNNTITGNNVCNNNMGGIRLYDSCNNNTITGNNISNNDDGIYLDCSSNNTIYFNNFINNTDNVDSYRSTIIWNSPFELTYTYDGNTYTNYVGNYWDDYEQTNPDAEEIVTTGIWNTPYGIAGNKDNYPLMERFENYIITTSAHTELPTPGFELLFAIIGVVVAMRLVRRRRQV